MAAAAATPTGLLCTSLTAQTIHGQEREMAEAAEAGADLVEIRLDYLAHFNPSTDIAKLLAASPLPVIVTFRPTWEGGRYEGPEDERLAVLSAAATMGAAYVDIELLAAERFFATGVKSRAPSTRFIVSSHDYTSTLSSEELAATLDRMWKVGADVAKIANTATDIVDVARMVALPATQPGPVIALSMSERGQLSRILAPKFGSMLTFGALRVGGSLHPASPRSRRWRDCTASRRRTRPRPCWG